MSKTIPCEFSEGHVRNGDWSYADKWRKGFFHAWAGLSEHPFAIVERASDGTVALVRPDGIRFTRRKNE